MYRTALRSALPWAFLIVACVGGTAAPSPTPTAASVAPSPTQTASPPTVSPRPTPSPTLSPSPAAATASLPPGACPTLRGGNPDVSRVVASVRVAHQPGFDRIVFDFGNGPLPPYIVEHATRFVGGASGLPVTVQGNAFLHVRFPRAGLMGQYQGPRSIQPGLPLVREVKVITDFEGVITFGLGLERQQCPKALELASPARLVLDFPTPP